MKLATTSGGECLFNVGWAVKHQNVREFGAGTDRICRRTPGARVGVVDRGVDVPKVDLAHEAIDLPHKQVRVARKQNARALMSALTEGSDDLRLIAGRSWQNATGGKRWGGHGERVALAALR